MDDDMVPYERDAVKFVRQVLEGLLFLHERNMAHLDIKLQNVLLMGTFPDCDVKLCDLEISRVIVAGQEVRELLGTPDYVSPEILHYEPITLSADIWSVGVMAYVLLTGFTPFGGDTDQETFQNICHGQLDFPDELFEDISPQAEDFIRKTLSREPSCRPTVKECLKHPWLTPWKHVASHQRETISSESQRKNSALHNCPTGAATLACPRSAASINGHGSSPSMTARSLLRAMSKSREVLYERVAASNLRKSTSKSRERLCEMRLSVSRSRDHLCDELQSSSAQSLERIHSLRNLSKSHEVLSLLNQQSSTISLADTSSLFNILPSTQSLECFTSPILDRDKHLEMTSNPISAKVIAAAGESNTFVDELLELNKVLSESTETLCEETGAATLLDVMDEVTPSNSRSVTPTEELDPDTQKAQDAVPEAQSADCKEKEMDENSNASLQLQPDEVVKFESLVTRADAVASSLKRLSSSGPPSSKILPSDSISPALGKSVWNWPIPSTSLTEGGGATCSTSKSHPVSPISVSPGPSASQKNSPSPPSFNLKDPQPSTSPLSTDESLAVVLRSDAACTDPPQNPPSAVVKTTDPAATMTPARMSATSIDTASLSDSQRQLLTSCLNRRRASWACGSRQEDVSAMINNTTSVSMSKQPETKLSVSELITSFNKCKKTDSTTSAAPPVIPSTGPIKPSNVKKMAVGSIFHQDSAVSHPASTSSGKVISEKEKTVFKPVSTSIQVFQKNLLTTPATTPTGLLMGTVQRNIEASTRPRSSWEIRALPRLPEDTVCSPAPQEEEEEGPAITSAASESGVTNSSEDKLIEDSKEKTITAPEEDYGLRSGSVSSDTGCSSSSDLSDRSSDEGLDGNREPRRKKTSGRECGNGSEPEADLIEGALTGPPASWTGRPRSFSVQSEISLLAQPWNRVCVGSVARAFEKFGTKVDGDTSSSNTTPPSTSNTHRSRRQSTPGPFK
ncbi:serine/threonine-protein kinase Nek5-like isoform X2 [Daphnia pulex]|nr:serine/threonine-protein kinase Nek5-like isoform X2 [Daphnia pulex]